MSRILLICLLLVSFLCHAQKIKFQIKAINPCHPNGKIDSSDYYLTGANKSIYRNKSGIIVLPKPGKYKLHHWDEPATDFPTINITTEGSFVYTIKETRISTRPYSMHGPYVYVICGKLINGYEEDFYPNGHLRIRGTFIEGYPKDSLVIFYPSGITQKRIAYLPLEDLVEEYDSLANLKMVGYFSNRAFYLGDYRKTEYFPNGKVRLKESSIDKLVTIQEYYPSGQVKTIQNEDERTEYYENGHTKLVYNWECRKSKVITDEYNFDYTITKKMFDEAGLLLEVRIYEKWGGYQPQSYLEFSKSHWINKWVKWKNGKEIIIARDIATEEYFRKPSNRKRR